MIDLARVRLTVTVGAWLDSLLLDLLFRDMDREPWALPSYEVAHGEEWVTTFLRPVEDF